MTSQRLSSLLERASCGSFEDGTLARETLRSIPDSSGSPHCGPQRAAARSTRVCGTPTVTNFGGNPDEQNILTQGLSHPSLRASVVRSIHHLHHSVCGTSETKWNRWLSGELAQRTCKLQNIMSSTISHESARQNIRKLSSPHSAVKW